MICFQYLHDLLVQANIIKKLVKTTSSFIVRHEFCKSTCSFCRNRVIVVLVQILYLHNLVSYIYCAMLLKFSLTSYQTLKHNLCQTMDGAKLVLQWMIRSGIYIGVHPVFHVPMIYCKFPVHTWQTIFLPNWMNQGIAMWHIRMVFSKQFTNVVYWSVTKGIFDSDYS